MSKYSERILDKSIWLTSTPIPITLNLPFYITEAGHFYAEKDYIVKRNEHDSFLFIYTLNGSGTIQSESSVIQLIADNAILIDCHKFHCYRPTEEVWEFIWVHMKGNAVNTFFKILYPNEIFAVEIAEPQKFVEHLTELINKTQKNDIVNSIELSAKLHEILNILIKDSIKNEHKKNKNRYSSFIKTVTEMIHIRYSEPILIDDMMKDIPLSKYYFIRIFKRIMGVTPYNYLIHYRINISKILLRSTDMSVGEIAEKCGFLDTSNFITQFKKYTGQRPLQYKNYFSVK